MGPRVRVWIRVVVGPAGSALGSRLILIDIIVERKDIGLTRVPLKNRVRVLLRVRVRVQVRVRVRVRVMVRVRVR